MISTGKTTIQEGGMTYMSSRVVERGGGMEDSLLREVEDFRNVERHLG